ncbi:MAG: hypothetical protein JWO79_1620 [Actinomycetia bacterium]|nr:hypothetical protein [Actinomycetes bacterium]
MTSLDTRDCHEFARLLLTPSTAWWSASASR